MIAILTDPLVGGTFLNWSIYYLSGHSHYYSAHTQKSISIVNNPLNSTNSHKFQPNQVTSINEFEKTLEILLKNKSSHLNTIYFHHFNGATKSYHQETADAIKKLLPYVSKTVLLTSPPNQALYHCSYATRLGSDQTPSLRDSNIMLTDDHLRFEDFISYFFGSSKESWEKLNLKNIWDQREFLALNFRPFSSQAILENLDLTQDHYHINTIELWDRFDESVSSLFQYLEIEINQNNFKKWNNVYQQWKKLHNNRLLFVWYFDIIIDYIIKGYNLDLKRFNLDICQEAAIQHALIYRHNLNLKTWQLEKFTNTQQLHELLEPNIHPLSQY